MARYEDEDDAAPSIPHPTAKGLRIVEEEIVDEEAEAAAELAASQAAELAASKWARVAEDAKRVRMDHGPSATTLPAPSGSDDAPADGSGADAASALPQDFFDVAPAKKAAGSSSAAGSGASATAAVTGGTAGATAV